MRILPSLILHNHSLSYHLNFSPEEIAGYLETDDELANTHTQATNEGEKYISLPHIFLIYLIYFFLSFIKIYFIIFILFLNSLLFFFLSKGQTERPNIDEKVNAHFLCFSCIDGNLYELGLVMVDEIKMVDEIAG